MALGKLLVPGRPINLDLNRARAYGACSRCGWGFRALSRVSQGPKTGPIPNCNFFKIIQNSQIFQLTPAIFILKCPISFTIFAKKAPSQNTWIKPWGCLDVFFISSIVSDFYLLLSGRRPDID